MPDILAEIVTRKRIEVAVARDRVPTAALEGRLSVAPAVRDFFAAVSAPGAVRLIAEFKRKKVEWIVLTEITWGCLLLLLIAWLYNQLWNQ
jgi:hypothetical protein